MRRRAPVPSAEAAAAALAADLVGRSLKLMVSFRTLPEERDSH